MDSTTQHNLRIGPGIAHTQKKQKTALFKTVQNDLLCTIDKHGVASLVMLDLSAAFDTVDYNVLLDHMQSLLCIGGTVLR